MVEWMGKQCFSFLSLNMHWSGGKDHTCINNTTTPKVHYIFLVQGLQLCSRIKVSTMVSLFLFFFFKKETLSICVIGNLLNTLRTHIKKQRCFCFADTTCRDLITSVMQTNETLRWNRVIVGDPLRPSLEHQVDDFTSEFTYKWLDCNRGFFLGSQQSS